MPEGSTQMFFGRIVYREQEISIALFTRPSDKLDCLVLSRPLFYVPDSGTEDVFEQLLFFNNGATEGVHFAVDEPLNTINLVCLRTMDGMSFQEFQYCVENIIAVARNSANRLIPEFGLMRYP